MISGNVIRSLFVPESKDNVTRKDFMYNLHKSRKREERWDEISETNSRHIVWHRQCRMFISRNFFFKEFLKMEFCWALNI